MLDISLALALGLLLFVTVGFFLLKKSRKDQDKKEQAAKINEEKSTSKYKQGLSESKNLQASPKPKQAVGQKEQVKLKNAEALSQEYESIYYGIFRLKAQNSIHAIQGFHFKGSKVLVSTSKNQLVLFNLKNWKKDGKNSAPEKFFVSLDNNTASAVFVGQKYYYAALTYDKTISYFEFIGEGGVYFRQVQKFPRNILKSNALSISVPKSESYIVTSGCGADTVIDVWSMKGEKLATTNSFQIQHYSVKSGLNSILVRGWTSQTKIFQLIEEKDGSFKKIEKKHHLAHEQSPICSTICNRDMFAMSIGKNKKIKIWNLVQEGYQKTFEADIERLTGNSQIIIKSCQLYTFESAVGHYKTISVLSHCSGFFITDSKLNLIQKIEGVDINQIYINGTQKSLILGTISNQSQIILWNLTKQLEKVQQFVL